MKYFFRHYTCHLTPTHYEHVQTAASLKPKEFVRLKTYSCCLLPYSYRIIIPVFKKAADLIRTRYNCEYKKHYYNNCNNRHDNCCYNAFYSVLGMFFIFLIVTFMLIIRPGIILIHAVFICIISTFIILIYIIFIIMISVIRTFIYIIISTTIISAFYSTFIFPCFIFIFPCSIFVLSYAFIYPA